MKTNPLLITQLVRLLALRSECLCETFDGCWSKGVALASDGLDFNSVFASLAAKPGQMNAAKPRASFGAASDRVVNVGEVDHACRVTESEKDRSLGWRQSPFDHEVEFVHAQISWRERFQVSVWELLVAISRAFVRRRSQ
jgi:hypothetical protein